MEGLVVVEGLDWREWWRGGEGVFDVRRLELENL
jgi:hypothetical protein